MAKCYQCSNVAMYLATEHNVPLCIDCFGKFSVIAQREIENAERAANFAADELDSMFGLGRAGARFPPRPAPVYVGGVRLNNINVSNSVVGTLNTGTIGSVDQTISALIQTAQAELASAIKKLTETVAASSDLTRNQQNEVLEMVSVIAKEASAPPEQRKKSVVRSLIKEASRLTDSAADIAKAAAALWPVIAAAFP